ncbi:MAG: periplasmic heavy metal sensor [Candidatus Omnitrophota bacterium]
MKKILILATVITVALALSPASTEAQDGCEDSGWEEERGPRGQRGPQGHGNIRGEQQSQCPTCGGTRQGKGKDLMKKLGLTEEQEEALREQRKGHREKVRSLMEALKEKKAQLRTELEKEEIDKEKIDSLINEIKPLLGNQIELRVEGALAMREILTPEQYKKFQEFAKKKHKQGWRGKGRGNKGSHGGFNNKEQGEEHQDSPQF